MANISARPARAGPVVAFALPFLCALAFALVTHHAWEDWYITYRSSKNLAAGNGLVYDIGARVHSFTSPLGTLIPAAIAFVLPAGADDTVLWVFRVLQCAMLGFSGVLLLGIARASRLPRWPLVFLLGMICLDAKTLDFSTNGMETGFFIFFILLAVKSTFSVPPRRKSWMTGLAWAGLMWTRPDGVVYIVALCASAFAFAERDRRALIRDWLRAGAWATALYGPWLLWTLLYYGSFIPHSLAAKALGYQPRGLIAIPLFPFIQAFGATSLDMIFAPANIQFGGWPPAIGYVSRAVGWVACYLWLAPGVSRRTRASSLGALIVQMYLTLGTPQLFGWYLPGAMVLSVLALASGAGDLTAALTPPRAPVARATVAVVTVCLLGAAATQSALAAYQLRVQQAVIEDGNRKPLGLWLRAHAASPRDTVFLEPLGYIGFFSNLRMYGFPGQSAPALVAARRAVGCYDRNPCYAALITYLKPDWLVLRPDEVAAIDTNDLRVLSEDYLLAKTFDVSSEVASYAFLPGRGWLNFDQTFLVYHRKAYS